MTSETQVTRVFSFIETDLTTKKVNVQFVGVCLAVAVYNDAETFVFLLLKAKGVDIMSLSWSGCFLGQVTAFLSKTNNFDGR